MAATSKSPRKILTVGYLIGKLALPDYAHKFSPKTYTQPQLFACLVLKEFLHRDYRGIEDLLKDTPELAAAIDLKKVPDFTTLQKAAGRLLVSSAASQLLDMTVRLGKLVGKLDAKAPLAAMDGTGLESRHASAYYVRRKAKGGKSEQKLTYQRFPKAGLVSECKSHLILAVVPQRGPGPDITHFRKAFDQARRRLRFTTLAADAGYDAEHTHVYGRSRGVRTLIPPLIGRPTTKPPSGYWRRTMLHVLPRSRYGQRWQSETVNSMLKRLLGSALRARTYWSQCRETVLRALTLNVMILRRRRLFDRASLTLSDPWLWWPKPCEERIDQGVIDRFRLPAFGWRMVDRQILANKDSIFCGVLILNELCYVIIPAPNPHRSPNIARTRPAFGILC